MDSISMDELLDLSIFKCNYCKKRCQYPVMTTDRDGNYCPNCLDLIEHVAVNENREINSILEKFSIPCRYRDSGCDVIDKISDVTKHEKLCEYRDKTCPFYSLKICKDVTVANIADHLINEHSTCVERSEDDMVKLSFNIETFTNTDIIRLLIIDYEYFLLHIKCDGNSNKVFYLVYLCGNSEDIKNYVCSIQQHNNDIYTKNKEFCLLHESEFTLLVNVEKAVDYDLSTLQRCFDKIETVIKISRKSKLTTVKNSELLKNLRCPSCKTYMRGEILQCKSGHSVCKECISELQKCSVCDSVFSGTRNYTLESLSSLLKYPCTHKGCNKYFAQKDIIKHEWDCNFRQYGCPFREILHCQWNTCHKDLIRHLKSDHRVKQSDYSEHKVSLYNIENDVHCLLAFNSIFRFHLEKEENIYLFICKYIGPKKLAKRFAFEIGLISQQQRDNKLIIRNSWNKPDDDELWIEIHKHDVAQYATPQQEILIYYKVMKYYGQ